MIAPVVFICRTCVKANREKKWTDRETDEWRSLTETWEHYRLNPTHEITAEVEVDIHI